MVIKFYKVACGDAACVSFRGDDGEVHYVFIDSGYERTFREILADEIRSIIDGGKKIDLWMISHIHDDHIGGAISYIKAIERGEAIDIVETWWYNSPQSILKPQQLLHNRVSEIKSFAQGERLSSYIYSLAANKLTDVTCYTELDVAGLHIMVLTPSNDILDQLRLKYNSPEYRRSGYIDLAAISEPASAVANDYHKEIDTFDLNNYQEDDSIENASSISVIMEFGSRKMLWLADCWSSLIAESLKMLGFSTENPLCVDIVKVSHHGSKSSNSSVLYSMIRCNKYVFSGNGDNKYQLPTKECMARILRNPSRSLDIPYQFIFPSDNPTLRNIFAVDGTDVFERLNFEMVYSDKVSIDISLIEN